MRKFRDVLAAFFAATSLSLAVCVAPSTAKPVSAATAKHAILADRFDFADTPTVEWCARKHYGTMCGIDNASLCFDDPIFGLSSITFRDVIWVSRTRGVVSVAVVGYPPVVIRPISGTCVPGELIGAS